MKIISLFDLTGAMVQPWLKAGYECFLFDGQHEGHTTEKVGNGTLHKIHMWFDPYNLEAAIDDIISITGEEIKVVFSFAECTDLTNAGSRHWAKKREENPNFQVEAMELVKLAEYLGNKIGCPWAVENPVGKLSTMWRKPDFKFHPCDYAGYLPEDDIHPLYPEVYPPQDRYNKNTCIWHGNGFKPPVKNHIPALYKDNPGWKKCGGKSLRTKNIRSCTPRGFAEAVYESNKLE